MKNIKEERAKQLDKLIEEAGCGHLLIKKVFNMGIPFQEILHAIGEEGVDIVVVGSKGSSDLSGIRV